MTGFGDQEGYTRAVASSNLRPRPMSRPQSPSLAASAPPTSEGLAQPALTTAVLRPEGPSSIFCPMRGAEDTTWRGKQARSLPPQGSRTFLVWQTPMHPSKPSSFVASSWRCLPVAPTLDSGQAHPPSPAALTVMPGASHQVFFGDSGGGGGGGEGRKHEQSGTPVPSAEASPGKPFWHPRQNDLPGLQRPQARKPYLFPRLSPLTPHPPPS